MNYDKATAEAIFKELQFFEGIILSYSSYTLKKYMKIKEKYLKVENE
jgi:hypothetical protein